MTRPTDEQAERAREILAQDLGEATAELSMVVNVVTVGRVTLRELLGPEDVAVPGREAREGELWECPEWMRRWLSGTPLAASWSETDYRDGALAAAVPASLREPTRRWIDELREDTGGEPRVEVEVARDEVAVIRVSRWDAALVGLSSGQLLCRLPVWGTSERAIGRWWATLVACLIAFLPPVCFWLLGAPWNAGSYGARALYLLPSAALAFGVVALRLTWVAGRDPRFRRAG